MRIAIMSDLHDNTAAWNILAKRLAAEEITTLINCGDTCSPAMLEKMAKSFPGEIFTIFGNVADRELEMEVVKTLPNVTHYGDGGSVKLAGRQIYFTHQPKEAESKIQSGEHNLVCHGHTHLKRWEKIGETFVVNPGTAGGMFQYPSFAIIDLEKLTCSFIDLTL